MALSGRKTIPFEIHEGKGTLRKHRHGSSGGDDPRPQVSSKKPKCPVKLLGPEGRKLWRHLMRSAGIVIKESHGPLLTMTCALWEDFVESRKDRTKTFTAAQNTQLRMCLVELGLTPSALSRLRAD